VAAGGEGKRWRRRKLIATRLSSRSYLTRATDPETGGTRVEIITGLTWNERPDNAGITGKLNNSIGPFLKWTNRVKARGAASKARF
jgi:hypothetical protein